MGSYRFYYLNERRLVKTQILLNVSRIVITLGQVPFSKTSDSEIAHKFTVLALINI